MKHSLAAMCLFLSAALLPAQQQPQDNAPTIYVHSRLVNVFVNVTDAKGAIIGGLTRDDFKLTEDNRPQQIAVFERQSAVPLALVMAIDTSGSVRKDMAIEQDAARRFVDAMMRPEDQMSLFDFATYVREVVPFTNDAKRIDHGLGKLQRDMATAVYDAVFLASDKLAKMNGRRVLVLVSDGGDTASDATYPKALEEALRGEVMVYSIIDVPIAASAGRDTGGEHALITLAEQTGGKYYYAADGNLDKAFQQLSEDLRTQYLLGYYPQNSDRDAKDGDSRFHRIRVTIPRATLDAMRVSHRVGYYDSVAKGDKE